MGEVIEYLAIIPARGGSKRLPGKNIKPLNGKPLIAWSIESATKSQNVIRTIVSTDDDAIAAVSKEYGVEVPFMRPADISGDKSSVVDALRHAVKFYEENGTEIRNIILLQVTSPFRTAYHVDAAIKAFESSKADALTSVSPARNHPYYALKGGTDKLEPFFDKEKLALRAFELPPAAYENGVIFIMTRDTLMNHGIYGKSNMVIQFEEPELTVDIDTAEDFALAEFMLQQREAAK